MCNPTACAHSQVAVRIGWTPANTVLSCQYDPESGTYIFTHFTFLKLTFIPTPTTTTRSKKSKISSPSPLHPPYLHYHTCPRGPPRCPCPLQPICRAQMKRRRTLWYASPPRVMCCMCVSDFVGRCQVVSPLSSDLFKVLCEWFVPPATGLSVYMCPNEIKLHRVQARSARLLAFGLPSSEETSRENEALHNLQVSRVLTCGC